MADTVVRIESASSHRRCGLIVAWMCQLSHASHCCRRQTHLDLTQITFAVKRTECWLAFGKRQSATIECMQRRWWIFWYGVFAFVVHNGCDHRCHRSQNWCGKMVFEYGCWTQSIANSIYWGNQWIDVCRIDLPAENHPIMLTMNLWCELCDEIDWIRSEFVCA